MVTSINGNNVTWRDSKTGNFITDVHQDLEVVNNRRSNMPNYGRSNRRTTPSGAGERRGRVTARRGRTGRTTQSNRNNTNQCLPGQHWMPAVNGKPGYCMNDRDHVGSLPLRRAGRVVPRRNRLVSQRQVSSRTVRPSNPANSGIRKGNIILSGNSRFNCPPGVKTITGECTELTNNRG